MAGFGRDWQHSHLLARGQVPVPNALREAVLPGLVGLLLELLSDPSAGRLLPALQAISWLVDVFVSDMPLKLRRYGKSWASLFPREVALVTGHPQWAKFCIDIMVQDDLAKQRMKNNRDFKGNPVEVCRGLVKTPRSPNLCDSQVCPAGIDKNPEAGSGPGCLCGCSGAYRTDCAHQKAEPGLSFICRVTDSMPLR